MTDTRRLTGKATAHTARLCAKGRVIVAADQGVFLIADRIGDEAVILPRFMLGIGVVLRVLKSVAVFLTAHTKTDQTRIALRRIFLCAVARGILGGGGKFRLLLFDVFQNKILHMITPFFANTRQIKGGGACRERDRFLAKYEQNNDTLKRKKSQYFSKNMHALFTKRSVRAAFAALTDPESV